MHFSRIITILAAGAYVSAAPMETMTLKTGPDAAKQLHPATNEMVTRNTEDSGFEIGGLRPETDEAIRPFKADNNMMTGAGKESMNPNQTIRPSTADTMTGNNMGPAAMAANEVQARADLHRENMGSGRMSADGMHGTAHGVQRDNEMMGDFNPKNSGSVTSAGKMETTARVGKRVGVNNGMHGDALKPDGQVHPVSDAETMERQTSGAGSMKHDGMKSSH